VEKMTFRLRSAGFKAQGVHLGILYRDWTFWHKGIKTSRVLFASRDFLKEFSRFLQQCPLDKPVREIHVSCFNLKKNDFLQLEIFENVVKKENLTKALDEINSRWGNFVVSSAKMLGTKNLIPDRIAFGLP
jgi:DNA polymerase-4